MRKNTKYFIEEAAIESGNYIIHYFFESQNFSGNRYIYNNTPYINYTGNFVGNLQINDNNLNFNGNSRLDINLQSFNSERFCFILNYEKNNNNSCVLFSNLNSGASGDYYGFNLCVNSYNNILIEYYDQNKQLKYLLGDINLDTKGVISLVGYSNYIKINYYNPASDDVIFEQFNIDNNPSPNVTGSIILGSGKFSQFPNYSGKLKDFIFINNDIAANQLNIIVDQFFYDLKSDYTFALNNEIYTYANYPDDSSNTFNSYIDITGCFSGFGDDFLENTGIIFGSITGTNYSLDLTGITGFNLPIPQNLLLLKNQIEKIEIFGPSNSLNDLTVIALLKDNTLTGWGSNNYGALYGVTGYVGNWTGSAVGQLTNIIDINCKNNACLALNDDGTVTGWGANSYGKIYGTIEYNGNQEQFTGNYIDSPLGELVNISDIELGLNHALFLNSDGQLISWGDNSYNSVAAINDRDNLAYPLKVIITGIYEDYSYALGTILDYTGNINSKPSYKDINDFQGLGINLYNNNTGWILNMTGISDSINLTGNTFLPSFSNNLNIPYQIVVDNSLDTGINVLYSYNSVSGYINNINDWRIFYSGTKWIVYSGITGYENGDGNDSLLPLNNWTGIEANNFFGDIIIKPKYIQLDYIYNSDNNGRFTGLFEETVVAKLTGISKISVGNYHNIALKIDGTITGWGGDGAGANPKGGDNLTGVLDISAGNLHTIAILNTNNSITGWGDDGYGQATDPLGLTGAIQIDAGNYSSSILFKDENLIYCGISSPVAYGNSLNKVKKYNSSEYGTYAEYISGQDVKNSVTGTFNYIFNKTVERPTVVNETITTIVSQISGFENQVLFSGVTGYTTGWMKDLPTFCGTGFSLYLTSGLTGQITGDVLTGVEIVTSSFNQERIVLQNQIYQTGFSSGISNLSKTGNYIYEFSFDHNGLSIDGTEVLYLDRYNYTNQSKYNLNKDEALQTIKYTNIEYAKNYSLEKKLNIINSYGIDDLIIEEELDNQDIIEIYLFKSNLNINTILDEELRISRASSNFRFASTGLNYIVNSNGVAQIFNKDYILIDTNLASPTSLNYDFGDYLDSDFVKTGDGILDYTGQLSDSLTPKDFIYLNGVKLISGYHYNFNGNNINYNIINMPITGLIYYFNSLVSYERYTGNSNFYDLPRFNKNTSLIWLNGIKLKFDSYYEISQNDQYYTPDFYDKTSNIIYNNTDTFINE